MRLRLSGVVVNVLALRARGPPGFVYRHCHYSTVYQPWATHIASLVFSAARNWEVQKEFQTGPI